MKKNKNRLTVLGSGTSTGIPMLGCSCSVCTSKDPKNKRLRTSIFIETINGNSFLVDTTPDLRTQLLKNKISSVDCVFITHSHADHVHGIDDLRPLCFKSPDKSIDIFTLSDTNKNLKDTFPYIFKSDEIYTKDKPPLGGGIPRLTLNIVDDSKELIINNDRFDFHLLPHGYTTTLGIENNGLAYLIDCHEIPQKVIEQLKRKNIELLIIDCVLLTPGHKSHLWVEKAFEYIRQIQPKRAGLIHMNHELDHEKLLKMAKETFDFPVFPLFDGQVLEY